MHRDDIAALAKGMVPFVREVVADAIAVPPELADQVASAVRMLHEFPPLAEPSAPTAKVIRIERDDSGNLVPIYGP